MSLSGQQKPALNSHEGKFTFEIVDHRLMISRCRSQLVEAVY
jgi:hypothetical protein